VEYVPDSSPQRRRPFDNIREPRSELALDFGMNRLKAVRSLSMIPKSRNIAEILLPPEQCTEK
jgi:hypothetical protein